jgi:hypothetical protein
MEEYRSGGGALFVYSNEEIRQALERHAQLTRHLWPGAFVILRKTSWGEYEAELRLRDVGPVQRVDAPSVGSLLEIVLPIVEAAAPDGWVTGD